MAKTPAETSVPSILRAAFLRKKQSNPGYSLRALARDLGVSPAFASKVMSGQKLPPKDRLEKLSFLLELDVPEKEVVVKAVLLDSFGEKVLGAPAKKRSPRATADASPKQILSSWANLAVLEGLSLESPLNELAGLGARLNLSPALVRRAIETLSAAGLIEETEGGWRKKEQLLYVAGGRSKSEVRAFHAAMIEKARRELDKIAQADYERRLINGFTMTLNTDHLERLKSKIIDFLDELSREAGEGRATEVYQCNVQLFPLTKPAE